ncbi:MAG: hypothetical protein AAF570_10085, partial [Bacteroidota bacterium]
KFRKLSPYDQLIVGICALAGKELKREVVEACFDEMVRVDRAIQRLADRKPTVALEALVKHWLVRRLANGYRYRCKPELEDSILWELAANHEHFRALSEAVPRALGYNNWVWADENDRDGFLGAFNSLRVAYFSGNNDFAPQLMQVLNGYPRLSREHNLLGRLLLNPVVPKRLNQLSPELRLQLLQLAELQSIESGAAYPAFEAYAKKVMEAKSTDMHTPYEKIYFSILQLMRGDWELVQHASEYSPYHYSNSLFEAVVAFMRGETEKSISTFESSWKTVRKGSKKRKNYFSEWVSIFYPLALLKTGDLDKIKIVEKIHRQTKDERRFHPFIELCFATSLFLNQRNARAQEIL